MNFEASGQIILSRGPLTYSGRNGRGIIYLLSVLGEEQDTVPDRVKGFRSPGNQAWALKLGIPGPWGFLLGQPECPGDIANS